MKKIFFVVVLISVMFSGCRSENEIIKDFVDGKDVLCKKHVRNDPFIINNKNWTYSEELNLFKNKEGAVLSPMSCY